MFDEWVSGHRGVNGNKRADMTTKRTIESEFKGPEPLLDIAKSTT